jgi:hypothetical protein
MMVGPSDNVMSSQQLYDPKSAGGKSAYELKKKVH